MIAYLTQAHIDYEIAVKRGLRDSYAWHQKVWEAFPDRKGEKRDFLTRLDDTDSRFRLLILSESLPVRPDWCPTDCWRTKEMDEKFLNPGTFEFSLLANATTKKVVHVDGERKKNGQRIPIVGEEDLTAWLLRKGEFHGFALASNSLKISSMPRNYFIKKGKSGLHQGTNFQGLLKVTDPALFRDALINGIGTAKAFGFGLLCLSPVKNQ